MWWDARKRKWQGADSLDFETTKAPDYEPDWSKQPQGIDALDGKSAFTMVADRRASLFVPSGLKDGPLPAHYEP
jgi:formate dehydrogenase major subunit